VDGLNLKLIFKVYLSVGLSVSYQSPLSRLELIDVTLKRSASRQLKFLVSSDRDKGAIHFKTKR